jgi:hypothetical protein
MERLGLDFRRIEAPPEWGALIRSTRDPTLFHSFGPWDEAEHIAAMRTSPEASAVFTAMQALCVEILPGDYELVAHIHVRASMHDDGVDATGSCSATA